jgi:hypothetical protein
VINALGLVMSGCSAGDNPHTSKLGNRPVRRIAAECAYVDERGGVGIRLEPAAAIVRRYGEQFRRAPRRQRRPGRAKPPPLL